MHSNRLVQLLTKQMSQPLGQAEKAELSALLQEAELSDAAAQLQRFWQQPKAIEPPVEASLAKVMAQIREEAQETKVAMPRRRRTYWLALPAMIGVLAIIAFLMPWAKWKSNTTEPVQAAANSGLVEKQNPKGIRSVIALADGSRVWLNADSKLSYPAQFSGNTREVKLSGEAFFEVARNATKPFLIHLKTGTVRVLGTSFNIKAYEGSPMVETSVSTGRVAFYPTILNADKKVDTTFLVADQKAVYSVRTQQVRLQPTSSGDDHAWTEGRLVFNGTQMTEIAAELERYFGKPVIIADEEIKTYRLTGRFGNNSAEEILYYLSKTKPFTYTVTDSAITLSLVH